MISFFPIQSETRLVPLEKETLDGKLEKHIKTIKRNGFQEEPKAHIFNGIWNEEGFTISLKLKISNNFIPIINGSYIVTEGEILIKLTYEMFPATKKLLLLWTVLTILITLFFVVLHQAWLYGAISFGFCLVNYILSIENFKLQVGKSKRMLDKMLS